MHTTWSTAALAGCVLAAAVSGCSLLRNDPVHDQWEDRANLPSCGTLKLDQGVDEGRMDTHPEVVCLQNALDSGQGAELKIESPTVEGDPVTEYYRVIDDGTTEVYVDATKDENSDQKWSYSDCATPESALEVNC